MSNPNANVRKFDGAVNAAAYWIYDHLLRAGDIVNDSTVTGTTVKAALNTLSAAVFPFAASGLAEQDLVSYDAGAATWRNRTVAAALKGTGATSLALMGGLAAGTNDIIIGPSAGNALNTGSNNIGFGLDVLDGATTALQDVIAVGNAALSGDLTAAANGTVAVGFGTLQLLTTPLLTAPQTAIGYQSLNACTTGYKNTTNGNLTGSRVTTGGRNSFFGDTAGSLITDGINNVAVGASSLSSGVSGVGVNSVVAVGTATLSGALTSAASGAVAIGQSVFSIITSGAKNVGVGYQAGISVTTGSRILLAGYNTNSADTADDNTFVGNEVGSTSAGSRNTALGSLAFNSAFGAVTDCVAIGYNAMTAALTTGANGSVGIGSSALAALTTGVNTAAGFANQLAITTGTRNTTLGYGVMSFVGVQTACSDMTGIGDSVFGADLQTTANGATAVGSSALRNLTSGAGNAALGYSAGASITTGSNGCYFGYGVGTFGTTTTSNCVGVGANAAVRDGCIVLGANASASSNNTLVIRVGNSSTTELVSNLTVNAKGGSTGAVAADTDYLTVVIGGVTRYIELKTTP